MTRLTYLAAQNNPTAILALKVLLVELPKGGSGLPDLGLVPASPPKPLVKFRRPSDGAVKLKALEMLSQSGLDLSLKPPKMIGDDDPPPESEDE